MKLPLKILFVLSFFFLFGKNFSKNIDSIFVKSFNIDSIIKTDLEAVEKLVNHSYVTRLKIIDFYNDIKSKSDEPFTPKELLFIKGNTNIFLEMRDSLYYYTYKYKPFLNKINKTVSINNEIDVNKAQALSLSTLSALTLYDNYLLGVVLLENNGQIRRLANEEDIGFKVGSKNLKRVSKAANSFKNVNIIRKSIELLDIIKQDDRVKKDSVFKYLNEKINTSYSYDYISNVNRKLINSKKRNLFRTQVNDLVYQIRSKGTYVLSKFLGNTAGVFSSRKGKLYADKIIYEDLRGSLKPLDILLEKTPFRLTDNFIPGYYGHAAIYIGNNKNKIFNQYCNNSNSNEYKMVASDQDSSNVYLIEALRSGVQINELKEFMNIDDIAVLRPKLNDNELLESYNLSYMQLGKKYDFNFDVNTVDKIVCSELIYLCYPHFSWPTEKTMGRFTISPDNIAELVFKGELELILLYVDGERVTDDNKDELFRKLLKN